MIEKSFSFNTANTNILEFIKFLDIDSNLRLTNKNTIHLYIQVRNTKSTTRTTVLWVKRNKFKNFKQVLCVLL